MRSLEPVDCRSSFYRFVINVIETCRISSILALKNRFTNWSSSVKIRQDYRENFPQPGIIIITRKFWRLYIYWEDVIRNGRYFDLTLSRVNRTRRTLRGLFLAERQARTQEQARAPQNGNCSINCLLTDQLICCFERTDSPGCSRLSATHCQRSLFMRFVFHVYYVD